MRAGPLDRKISIRRKTTTASDTGFLVESWSTLSLRRSASYRALKGDERFQGPQVVSSEQVEFRIRYSSDVADLTPQDQIVFPALESGDPEPVGSRIYDILAVHQVGRREGLQIIAARRPDVST